MTDLKFVPQALLDAWAERGKVQLVGNTLRIPSEGVEFALSPAVRFLALLEGEDRHGLMCKVKSASHLREIGGEVMDDSCLVGDTAYQVEPGFLAEGVALATARAARETRTLAIDTGAAAPAPTGVSAPEEGTSVDAKEETDLLTRFLLESLE